MKDLAKRPSKNSKTRLRIAGRKHEKRREGGYAGMKILPHPDVPKTKKITVEKGWEKKKGQGVGQGKVK